MNPYNQPYGFPQQTPGPPQPPWQAPPRRQGWTDPRLPSQSPGSPYNSNSHAFGPPLPPPPLPTQPTPPPPQVDTSAWGVRYNQGLVSQNYDPKPPLPPRPSSAAGQASPRPDHAATVNYPPQAPPNPSSQPPSQQYPTSWSDPYHSNPSPQASTFPPPPPPPPRPAEYQAQIQAQHNRVNIPHQEYSHHPASHHYEPQSQNAWNTISAPPTGPTYHPTAPAPQQISEAIDGPLVSPIEPSNAYWGQQGHSTAGHSSNNYHTNPKPDGKLGSSQALGFGGPSDWERYETGAPPEQTPTSPPNPQANNVYQAQGSVSPPQGHATLPTSQASKPSTPRPPSPIEIGAPSPVTPWKESHAQPPAKQAEPPPPHIDERPSSAGQRSNFSVRSDSMNGTGNIDSVIQAWNAPLKVKSSQEPTSRPDSRTSTRVATPEPIPSVKVVDPYDDLEPEFKASLKRYAAMLRKESAADTDEGKFHIFETFVTKELRLRSLLYGVELKKETKEVKKAASLADIPATPPQPVAAGGPGEASEQIRSENKAAEPIAPPVQQQFLQQPSGKEAPVPTAAIPIVRDNRQSKLENTTATQAVPPTPRPQTQPAVEQRPRSRDDAVAAVGVDGDDEEAYSPGGRPITKVRALSPGKSSVGTTTQDTGHAKYPESAPSPSTDAPMVIEDYVMPDPSSPSINAPILVVPEASQPSPGRPSQANKPVVPIKFEPPRPAYTPFRYSTAVEEEKTKPLQPADRAYSSLRHSVADSGRLMAQETLLTPPRPSSTSGRKEHEEAFIGLIRKQSMAVRQTTPGLPGPIRLGDTASKAEPPVAVRVGTPANVLLADPLKQAVTALRSLLPKDASVEIVPHPQLQSVKSKIDAVPDQFGFIHETVVEWDRTNREVRKQQDAERQARQEESETHIDALFHDNEIGYADIGDLEAEFKLVEAERKYRENQEELESFTAQVFAPVTERLQRDIAELMTVYTVAIDLLDLESEPVSRCLKGNGDRARMSEVMNCVLNLFNKIEIRHRKVAEAHVERERRRKHLELTVLYTNGDTAGVKRLEKEFAVAEKMQVLHEAREKDRRANKLMDTFDRATVRALGDNQMFIDDVLAKLQDLKKAIFAGNGPAKDQLYEPEGPRDTLSLAQDVVDIVVADSRRLLALSNEADVLLNDADYAVSVAEARVANADKATYDSLEKEKAKEDTKLIEETNARIRSVTKGPQEAITLIREVIDQIGDDPEHQDRIKKALEAAKQRNASIDVGGT
ncbi:uncharacterized protein Z518_10499 [Rhinocladiella mackenziei CBS 650.93]|uniref:Uncharacterized protein n=1 Tax=Rhinocladiella mackenziei CBS 650.93 TaxID=1442369 RepID=A0A0D2IUF8_9EURO|nr:uncharacterized protein Z518_10499 [Rhinocladiella mackenziei CBS 650.93]KIX00360.1 hypothetical protein Z518_10499 [Rhinocladiella mackenziei CBS 650.93]